MYCRTPEGAPPAYALQNEASHHLDLCAYRVSTETWPREMQDLIYAKLPIMNCSHIFLDEALARKTGTKPMTA